MLVYYCESRLNSTEARSIVCAYQSLIYQFLSILIVDIQSIILIKSDQRITLTMEPQVLDLMKFNKTSLKR